MAYNVSKMTVLSYLEYSAPYKPNLPFLIYDIRACQKLKMVG